MWNNLAGWWGCGEVGLPNGTIEGRSTPHKKPFNVISDIAEFTTKQNRWLLFCRNILHHPPWRQICIICRVFKKDCCCADKQMASLEFWAAPLFWYRSNFLQHLRPFSGNWGAFLLFFLSLLLLTISQFFPFSRHFSLLSISCETCVSFDWNVTLSCTYLSMCFYILWWRLSICFLDLVLTFYDAHILQYNIQNWQLEAHSLHSRKTKCSYCFIWVKLI